MMLKVLTMTLFLRYVTELTAVRTVNALMKRAEQSVIVIAVIANAHCSARFIIACSVIRAGHTVTRSVTG